MLTKKELEWFEVLRRRKIHYVETLDEEDDGLRDVTRGMYSDQCHFVYELLQNANDAKATNVKFILEKDKLIFIHNGERQFLLSNPDINVEKEDKISGKIGDINSITKYGRKKTELKSGNSIGKFGIGFKAVFDYTETPKIYSDKFKFALEKEIIPFLLKEDFPIRKKGETLFVFPFNKEGVSAEKSYNDIKKKLETLSNPILFLPNLRSIKVENGGNAGFYSKNIREEVQIDEETTFDRLEVDNYGKKSNLLKFTRKLKGYSYCVCFCIDDNNKLIPAIEKTAYCFFPTKEKTNLNFIIHAPFLLNPSRENILIEREENKDFIDGLACLAADAIYILKERYGKERIIDDSILDYIPLSKNIFNVDSSTTISFLPFFEKIRNLFATKDILPTKSGYTTVEKACLVEYSDYTRVFEDEKLSLLRGKEAYWVFPSFGFGNFKVESDKRSFLSSLKLAMVYETDLLELIKDNKDFVKSQFETDKKWLNKLYEWFCDTDKRVDFIKNGWILINSKGEVSQTVDIYLPLDLWGNIDDLENDISIGCSIIHPNILEMEFGKKLVEKLKIESPSLKSLIDKYLCLFDVKRKYNEVVDKWFISLSLIFKYYKNANLEERESLIEKLSQKCILKEVGINNEQSWLYKPADVYFPTEELLQYAEYTKSFVFVDVDFFRRFEENVFIERFLKDIGVKFFPSIKCKKIEQPIPGVHPKNDRYLSYNNGKQSWYEFEVDGFDDIIKAKIHKKIEDDFLYSNLVFSIIKKNLLINESLDFSLEYGTPIKIDTLSCLLEGVYISRYNNGDNAIPFDSKFKHYVQDFKWLLDKDRNLISAKGHCIEDLSDFYKNELNEVEFGEFIKVLGIKSKNDEEDKFRESLSELQQRQFNLGKICQENNFSEEDLEKLKRIKEQEKLQVSSTSAASRGSEFGRGGISLGENPDMSWRRKNVNENSLNNKSEDNISKSIEKNTEEDAWDSDEYRPKPVNYEKKIKRLKEKHEAELREIERSEDLQEEAMKCKKYSYGWFKALLKMEMSSSFEDKDSNKELKITFSKVVRSSNGHLILKYPDKPIPHYIEDLYNIPVEVLTKTEEKIKLTFEAMSVKSFDLHVKLLNPEKLRDLQLIENQEVEINAKSPAFLDEELSKKFFDLKDSNGDCLSDSFDMKSNLTEKIKFVFGPPGTGKTTHLAKNEILPMMKLDKKVLVLTPTNKAADVLTNRIADSAEDESFKNWLVRFGNTADEQIEKRGILQDRNFEIGKAKKAVVITTIARYPYDKFYCKGDEGDSQLDAIDWDCIIIDEASMIRLINLIYPLYKKNCNFIIAGDPFQIEPIASVDLWKDENIYKMVCLTDFKNTKTEPHDYEVVKLETQYRSIPSIGDVFSKLTYNGLLKHNRRAESAKMLNIGNFLKLKPLNIIKFPVEKYEGVYKAKKLNNSNFHVYSALFTYEFICKLSEEIMKNNLNLSVSIGVIAAYKPQANLVDRLLASARFPENIRVTAGTIHGFQGDECDIIITLFNPPPKISDKKEIFLNKQNIVNVAISRARDCLIVVMPDEKTENIEQLRLINELKQLIKSSDLDFAEFSSNDLEEKMFGDREFLKNQVFSTTHQNVNVYSKPQYLYEIRSEENNLDVQIKKPD